MIFAGNTDSTCGASKNPVTDDTSGLTFFVISVAASAQKPFSDKFGHSNYVILRDSCKVANLEAGS
jgi:hypothetical protein